MKSTIPTADLEAYKGQWVALDPVTHAIISHDPSLEVAEKKAIQQGQHKPLLMPVPESDAFFVGVV